MAKVNLGSVVGYLDRDVRKAVEYALGQQRTRETIDTKKFVKDMIRKLPQWETVPDAMVRAG